MVEISDLAERQLRKLDRYIQDRILGWLDVVLRDAKIPDISENL